MAFLTGFVLLLLVVPVFSLTGFDMVYTTDGIQAPHGLLTLQDGTVNHDIFTNGLTVCLWALLEKTESNRVALFSYSSMEAGTYDEVLCEIDFEHFVTNFYINGYSLTFSAIPERGEWTHICTTWSSDAGMAYLYINGVYSGRFGALGKDHLIGGRGFFIVGQAQHYYNGYFTPATGVTGRLTAVNLWERPLKSNEVVQAKNCSLEGDIIKWSESYWGLYEMQIAASTAPCGTCE